MGGLADYAKPSQGRDTYATQAGQANTIESNKPKESTISAMADSAISAKADSKQGKFASSAYNLASKSLGEGATNRDWSDFGAALAGGAGTGNGSGGASHSTFAPVSAINTETGISTVQRQQMAQSRSPAQLRSFDDYLTEALNQRM